ncbi:MAG: hypothetical protein EZS28_002076 [Streblomastix strix]|uniref:Uncharacterized protein n=1 Tax=Streblomastix strix TaxID=222440 RepID=A0A5J4X775_9EUKA|nr:MAG: hypothetical protein EZS28_002076 [Streblomastix strix]
MHELLQSLTPQQLEILRSVDPNQLSQQLSQVNQQQTHVNVRKSSSSKERKVSAERKKEQQNEDSFRILSPGAIAARSTNYFDYSRGRSQFRTGRDEETSGIHLSEATENLIHQSLNLKFNKEKSSLAEKERETIPDPTALYEDYLKNSSQKLRRRIERDKALKLIEDHQKFKQEKERRESQERFSQEREQIRIRGREGGYSSSSSPDIDNNYYQQQQQTDTFFSTYIFNDPFHKSPDRQQQTQSSAQPSALILPDTTSSSSPTQPTQSSSNSKTSQEQSYFSPFGSPFSPQHSTRQLNNVNRSLPLLTQYETQQANERKTKLNFSQLTQQQQDDNLDVENYLQKNPLSAPSRFSEKIQSLMQSLNILQSSTLFSLSSPTASSHSVIQSEQSSQETNKERKYNQIKNKDDEQEQEQDQEIKVIDRGEVYQRYLDQKKQEEQEQELLKEKDFNKEEEEDQEEEIKVIDRGEVYQRYLDQKKQEEEEQELLKEKDFNKEEEEDQEEEIKVIDRGQVYQKYLDQKKQEEKEQELLKEKDFNKEQQDQEEDIKVIDRGQVYQKYLDQKKKEDDEDQYQMNKKIRDNEKEKESWNQQQKEKDKQRMQLILQGQKEEINIEEGKQDDETTKPLSKQQIYQQYYSKQITTLYQQSKEYHRFGALLALCRLPPKKVGKFKIVRKDRKNKNDYINGKDQQFNGEQRYGDETERLINEDQQQEQEEEQDGLEEGEISQEQEQEQEQDVNINEQRQLNDNQSFNQNKEWKGFTSAGGAIVGALHSLLLEGIRDVKKEKELREKRKQQKEIKRIIMNQQRKSVEQGNNEINYEQGLIYDINSSTIIDDEEDDTNQNKGGESIRNISLALHLLKQLKSKLILPLLIRELRDADLIQDKPLKIQNANKYEQTERSKNNNNQRKSNKFALNGGIGVTQSGAISSTSYSSSLQPYSVKIQNFTFSSSYSNFQQQIPIVQSFGIRRKKEILAILDGLNDNWCYVAMIDELVKLLVSAEFCISGNVQQNMIMNQNTNLNSSSINANDIALAALQQQQFQHQQQASQQIQILTQTQQYKSPTKYQQRSSSQPFSYIDESDPNDSSSQILLSAQQFTNEYYGYQLNNQFKDYDLLRIAYLIRKCGKRGEEALLQVLKGTYYGVGQQSQSQQGQSNIVITKIGERARAASARALSFLPVHYDPEIQEDVKILKKIEEINEIYRRSNNQKGKMILNQQNIINMSEYKYDNIEDDEKDEVKKKLFELIKKKGRVNNIDSSDIQNIFDVDMKGEQMKYKRNVKFVVGLVDERQYNEPQRVHIVLQRKDGIDRIDQIENNLKDDKLENDLLDDDEEDGDGEDKLNKSLKIMIKNAEKRNRKRKLQLKQKKIMRRKQSQSEIGNEKDKEMKKQTEIDYEKGFDYYGNYEYDMYDEDDEEDNDDNDSEEEDNINIEKIYSDSYNITLPSQFHSHYSKIIEILSLNHINQYEDNQIYQFQTIIDQREFVSLIRQGIIGGVFDQHPIPDDWEVDDVNIEKKQDKDNEIENDEEKEDIYDNNDNENLYEEINSNNVNNQQEGSNTQYDYDQEYSDRKDRYNKLVWSEAQELIIMEELEEKEKKRMEEIEKYERQQELESKQDQEQQQQIEIRQKLAMKTKEERIKEKEDKEIDELIDNNPHIEIYDIYGIRKEMNEIQNEKRISLIQREKLTKKYPFYNEIIQCMPYPASRAVIETLIMRCACADSLCDLGSYGIGGGMYRYEQRNINVNIQLLNTFKQSKNIQGRQGLERRMDQDVRVRESCCRALGSFGQTNGIETIFGKQYENDEIIEFDISDDEDKLRIEKIHPFNEKTQQYDDEYDIERKQLYTSYLPSSITPPISYSNLSVHSHQSYKDNNDKEQTQVSLTFTHTSYNSQDDLYSPFLPGAHSAHPVDFMNIDNNVKGNEQDKQKIDNANVNVNKNQNKVISRLQIDQQGQQNQYSTGVFEDLDLQSDEDVENETNKDESIDDKDIQKSTKQDIIKTKSKTDRYEIDRYKGNDSDQEMNEDQKEKQKQQEKKRKKSSKTDRDGIDANRDRQREREKLIQGQKDRDTVTENLLMSSQLTQASDKTPTSTTRQQSSRYSDLEQDQDQDYNDSDNETKKEKEKLQQKEKKEDHQNNQEQLSGSQLLSKQTLQPSTERTQSSAQSSYSLSTSYLSQPQPLVAISIQDTHWKVRHVALESLGRVCRTCDYEPLAFPSQSGIYPFCMNNIPKGLIQKIIEKSNQKQNKGFFKAYKNINPFSSFEFRRSIINQSQSPSLYSQYIISPLNSLTYCDSSRDQTINLNIYSDQFNRSLLPPLFSPSPNVGTLTTTSNAYGWGVAASRQMNKKQQGKQQQQQLVRNPSIISRSLTPTLSISNSHSTHSMSIQINKDILSPILQSKIITRILECVRDGGMNRKHAACILSSIGSEGVCALLQLIKDRQVFTSLNTVTKCAVICGLSNCDLESLSESAVLSGSLSVDVNLTERSNVSNRLNGQESSWTTADDVVASIVGALRDSTSLVRVEAIQATGHLFMKYRQGGKKNNSNSNQFYSINQFENKLGRSFGLQWDWGKEGWWNKSMIIDSGQQVIGNLALNSDTNENNNNYNKQGLSNLTVTYLQPQSFLMVIFPHLNDVDVSCRKAAAMTLARCGGAEGELLLMETVLPKPKLNLDQERQSRKEKDETALAREAAIRWGLNHCGVHTIWTVMLALNDQSEIVRKAAENLLLGLGSDRIVKELKRGREQVAVQILGVDIGMKHINELINSDSNKTKILSREQIKQQMQVQRWIDRRQRRRSQRSPMILALERAIQSGSQVNLFVNRKLKEKMDKVIEDGKKLHFTELGIRLFEMILADIEKINYEEIEEEDQEIQSFQEQE